MLMLFDLYLCHCTIFALYFCFVVEETLHICLIQEQLNNSNDDVETLSMYFGWVVSLRETHGGSSTGYIGTKLYITCKSLLMYDFTV